MTLINCISLSRITGPGSWSWRPGGWSGRPGARSGQPGVAALFAIGAATLLIGTTLFTVCVLTLIGYTPDPRFLQRPVFALSAISAALFLLPLAAWIRLRHAMPYQRLRLLLPVAAIEAIILSSLLLAHTELRVMASLLWSLCAGAGTVLMVMVFGDLRMRLGVTDAPKAWHGLPLELMTAGILALALLSPAGALA